MNSISSQNVVMKLLIERIGDELRKDSMPPELKKTLMRIQQKMLVSLDLSLVGEKMISYLVDDFLDLG